jgi:hypothetical protein
MSNTDPYCCGLYEQEKLVAVLGFLFFFCRFVRARGVLVRCGDDCGCMPHEQDATCEDCFGLDADAD